ncbi:RsmB/NOP family class I SAM-dependent RNA methyltransferase [bacterium]|nr:RsmB/NOP family class I SAM-dependent RNA methyltransferase [bacterium]
MSSNTSPVLTRYGAVVPDEQAFYACSTTPLEVTGWLHPFRRHEAISFAPSSSLNEWHPGFFQTQDTSSSSFLIGFLSGGLLVQEKSAMTAVGLLGIGAGSQVLDLCAAPGNKTAQISMLVGETGLVVANDLSKSRLGVVHGTMDRLGLSNVMTTAHDARHFPIPTSGFDAVLADVPCSCEGTSRKYPDILRRSNEAERVRLVNVQKQILARALQCVKPGGRVVYSTCTYAPEENEAVVNWALGHAPSGMKVQLQDVSVPGFMVRPGITSWSGESYDSSLSRCARIWPHENDSGGFFLAVLERLPDSMSDQSGREGNLEMPTPIEVSDWPWKAYGFQEEDLSPWGIHSFSRKYNRLVRAGGFEVLGLPAVAHGVSGLNLKSEYPKLSTALTQKLGRFAKINIAEIDPSSALAFFNRESIPSIRTAIGTSESNTVIVRMGGLSLGLATWDAQAELLYSKFPKVWGGLTVSDRM